MENTEFIEYEAAKLQQIYELKEQEDDLKVIRKKTVQMSKWKFFRNVCVIALYVGLFLSQPQWCMNAAIDASCQANQVEHVDYFNVQSLYLSREKIEITSWLIMVVLLIYDLLLLDLQPRRILGLTILFLLDIVFGFLFMNGILSLKLNQLIRLLFVFYYLPYTNMVVSGYLQFCWKVRKVFFLVCAVVCFTGLALFVLYFDATATHQQTVFHRLDFATILSALYTSYTIFTFQNSLNIINFTLLQNPLFLVILVPLFFSTLFLLTSFIVAVFSQVYTLLVQKNIKQLSHYPAFREIINFYRDSRGFLQVEAIKDVIRDFYSDPQHVDFKQYNAKQEKLKQAESRERKEMKRLNHNAIHSQKFLAIKSKPWYRVAHVSIDALLALLPILILNLQFWGLNECWYFVAIVLCAFSCVHPFLALNFLRHKMHSTRRKLYQFKFLLSFTIVILALLLPLQSRKPNLTLEQSNDLLFIAFSLLCFLKTLTVIDELLLQNRILLNSFVIFKHLLPLLLKIFTLLFLMLFLYSFVGDLLYGGRINSESISQYESAFGVDVREKYEFLNFNSPLNGAMSLFVLLLNNNWIFVAEMMYFVRSDVWSYLYLISYGMLVRFVSVSLLLGLITKVIVLYFDQEFELEKQDFWQDNLESGSESESEEELEPEQGQ